eukprot:280265_1
MAVQYQSDNGESDFSDDLAFVENKTTEKENTSDEFALAFSEKQKRLKPSKAQKVVENQTQCITLSVNKPKPNKNDDENGIAIQTEILSDYLKPTNILSKYQNGPVPNNVNNNEPEEEEEKEWPTNKEELEFNNVTYTFDQQYYNGYDDNIESDNQEEKSDFDPIDFEDLYPCLIEQANDEIDFDDIIIEDFRNISWFDYMKIYIFGGCSIALKTQKLNEERDAIFKMAKLKLDLANDTHNRMLQTLWMKLIDDTRQCDKTGSHWQQIGFQGNDPSTDIRGSGLFGVLQLIYIIENYDSIISKIYSLSVDAYQHFPLAIVSFSISGIVIRLLRSCLIYNDINAKKSVTDSINEIYVALFYEFYLQWKNKSRTIIKFDEAQKELENKTFTNWNGLITQLIRGTSETEEYNDQKQHLIPDLSDSDTVEFGISKNTKNSDKVNSRRQNQYQL